MSYQKGDPDCLAEDEAEQYIEILYHTTKIEIITHIDGKIWHKPSTHKPPEFEKW